MKSERTTIGLALWRREVEAIGNSLLFIFSSVWKLYFEQQKKQ
jgi:hypothetical protein